MDLDKLIPEKWRLDQRYDDGRYIPQNYPVFLKPEWSQNAGGIHRADSEAMLIEARSSIRDSDVAYLIQQGASESREFEIFSLRSHNDKSTFSVLTITEACNEAEANPVNSIYNPDTQYFDKTNRLNNAQKQTLWRLLESMGSFSICRLSVRANSLEALLNEKFHVIELNLFTPFPIHMLDQKFSFVDLAKMVLGYMYKLAKLTRLRDKTLKEKPVYTKLMLYNRRGFLANYIRARA